MRSARISSRLMRLLIGCREDLHLYQSGRMPLAVM